MTVDSSPTFSCATDSELRLSNSRKNKVILGAIRAVSNLNLGNFVLLVGTKQRTVSRWLFAAVVLHSLNKLFVTNCMPLKKLPPFRRDYVETNSAFSEALYPA